MKTLLLSGAILAALGLAIAPVEAQTQSSTTTSTSSNDSYVQTSKIVGMKVKSSNGEEVGTIKDVVLDRNTGCMAYTVLSTGGGGGGTSRTTTTTTKTVAVPWSVYSVGNAPGDLTVRVDRDRIY